MTGYLIACGWVLCGLVAARWVFRAFAADIGQYGGLDWMDVTGGLFIAVIVGLFFWPLAAAFAALRAAVGGKDADAFARRLGGESREQKMQRRERELWDREARIRALEREAGIG